jgi:hypothetical protein
MLSEIDRFGHWQRCAASAILAWSRRFEAALRAGQAFFLCAGRNKRGPDVGQDKDLRQIQ